VKAPSTMATFLEDLTSDDLVLNICIESLP
jgi:hypothetical protein